MSYYYIQMARVKRWHDVFEESKRQAEGRGEVV
jgi:hypothetical protein